MIAENGLNDSLTFPLLTFLASAAIGFHHEMTQGNWGSPRIARRPRLKAVRRQRNRRGRKHLNLRPSAVRSHLLHRRRSGRQQFRRRNLVSLCRKSRGGLATAFFTLVILGEFVEKLESNIILSVTMVAFAASTFLHGITDHYAGRLWDETKRSIASLCYKIQLFEKTNRTKVTPNESSHNHRATLHSLIRHSRSH